MQNTLFQVSQTVLHLATAKGVRLVTAESCTGGMVAAALTEHAGSSQAMWGGIVAYANDMKEQLLAVPAELLAGKGAVSPEVAKAMAEGAVNTTTATLAVSITGIAGPGGGTATKPVGLVEFATFAKGDKTAQANTAHFEGDRATIRHLAALHALNLLKARLEAL